MARRRVDREFCEAATADLSELILLAAPSRESNLPIVERQERLWTSFGWKARRFAVADDGPVRTNLLLTRSEKPTVLFCCHVDTVPAGEPRFWTETGGSPRTPVAWNGRVFGLGASDTLASAAVLDTLASRGRLDDNVAVVFTADEEVGAVGAGHFVRADGVPASVRLVVVCEPTDNLVVRGTKGYFPFDVVARGAFAREVPGTLDPGDVRLIAVVGQEAHSATPALGRNALFEAACLDDVTDIRDEVVVGAECRGIRSKVPGFVGVQWAPREAIRPGGTHAELRLAPVLELLTRIEALAAVAGAHADLHFNPPEVTLNVGALSADGDDLVLACDLRPIPGFDPWPLLDRVRAEAASLFPGATLRVPFGPIPPVWTEVGGSLREAIFDRLDPHGRSAFNEAAVFSLAGHAPLIAGPGNQLTHRSNEYVDVVALDEGAKLYERLAAAGDDMDQADEASSVAPGASCR
jgi:acetylornithine deacetylase/succinyl-diaminopimelate desuccinylase-like protein